MGEQYIHNQISSQVANHITHYHYAYGCVNEAMGTPDADQHEKPDILRQHFYLYIYELMTMCLSED